MFFLFGVDPYVLLTVLFEAPPNWLCSEGCRGLLCVANQDDRAALFAFPDSVMLCELAPVPLLIRREDAESLAKRTDVIQRVEDRRTDELRAVGHSLQDFGELRFHLEGDHLVLVLFVLLG